MKTVRKQIKRSLFISAMVVTLYTCNIQRVFANGAINPYSPIELQYIGKHEDQPVFKLNINNQDGSEVLLRMEDQDKRVIFSDKFSTTSYSKKLAFTELADVQATLKITLTLSSQGEKKVHNFVIASETELVENVVVTKVSVDE